MVNGTPSLHSLSEDIKTQKAYTHGSDGQEIPSLPATDNRGTEFEGSTAGEILNVQETVSRTVAPDSPVASNTQGPDVRPASFPQAHPNPHDTDESANENIPNPTEKSMDSNTSRLFPVSDVTITAETELQPRLYRDVFDQQASFQQASPAPAVAEENAAVTEVAAPRETDAASNTPRLITVIASATSTESEPHSRLRHDPKDQPGFPVPMLQASPGLIDAQEKAAYAEIHTTPETTMSSNTSGLVSVSASTSLTEREPHAHLRRNLVDQLARAIPFSQVSPGSFDAKGNVAGIKVHTPSETIMSSNTPPLPTSDRSIATEHEHHPRLRSNVVDHHVHPTSFPQASPGPVGPEENENDMDISAPTETLIDSSASNLVAVRDEVTSAEPVPHSSRIHDQHVRPTPFQQTPPGPVDIEENTTHADIRSPTETLVGSSASRIVRVRDRTAVTIIDQPVGQTPFQRTSSGVADIEEIPTSRGTGIGSTTSRLGSAGIDQDVLHAAFPRAPRRSVDIEGNAPTNDEFDPLSFSIYIGPNCITPQIQWRVPHALKKNWMQRHFPFFVGSPIEVRNQKLFDSLLEVTEQYGSFFISGKEVYRFMLVRHGQLPIILDEKNFLEVLDQVSNTEIRAILREKTFIPRKVIHSFKGVKAIFALLAVVMALVTGILKINETVKIGAKAPQVNTQTPTKTVTQHVFAEWNLQ